MSAFLTAVFLLVASLAQAAGVPLLDFWDPTNNLGTFNDWIINSLDPALGNSGAVASPGWANVLDYGADPSGVADSTSQFNTALASGKCVYAPTGTYKITGAITFPVHEWCFFGDGETKTVLSVNSTTFNLAAQGVIVIPNNGGGDGGRAHDFGISFSQPDTNVRASLVAFPPGIYMQGVARPILQNIQFNQALTCIDGRGNMGGAFFDNINCGALSYGLRMDGSKDGSHIHAWHEWDFGINLFPGLVSIYEDGTNTCFELGRVDWIGIDDAQCFYANVHWVANAANSQDSNMISNLALDNGGIIQDASPPSGNWITNVQNAGSMASPTALGAVAVSAGHLNISGYRFGSNSNSLNPAVKVTGSGSLNLVNGVLVDGPTSVQAATVSGGFLGIYDSLLSAPAGLAVPMVEQISGYLHFSHNRMAAPPVGGTGVAAKFGADSTGNLFSANALNGWNWTPSANQPLNAVVYPTNAAMLAGITVTAGLTASSDVPAQTIIRIGNGAEGDGGGATYDWNPASMATADSFVVLLPTNQDAGTAGRYIRRKSIGQVVAVASLPVCNGVSQGQTTFVSDAAAPTYGATLTGGSTVYTIALCNGTAWVAH